jgi:hypothetical protein
MTFGIINGDVNLTIAKNIRQGGGSGEKGLVCDTFKRSALVSQARKEFTTCEI